MNSFLKKKKLQKLKILGKNRGETIYVWPGNTYSFERDGILPKGKDTILDKYFNNVDRYISHKNNNLETFRSIASIENIEKARWVIERTNCLLKSGKFSSAFFPIESKAKFPIIGFHIVYRKKHETPYIYIFPPVSPGGITHGFLLRNKEIADIMLKYFDAMWFFSNVITEGLTVNKEELENLASSFDDIKNSEHYKELYSHCS